MSILNDSQGQPEQEEDSFRDGVPQPKPIRNFRRLLLPQNRVMLYAICGVSAFVLIVIFVAIVSLTEEAQRQPALETLNAPDRFGKELNPLRDAIDDINENHHEDRQRVNPSAQPIPTSERDDYSGAFTEETKADDVCSSSDTICLRRSGRIADDECAPDDHICQSLLVVEVPSEAPPADYYASLASNSEYMSTLQEFRTRIKSEGGGGSVVTYTPPENQRAAPIESAPSIQGRVTDRQQNEMSEGSPKGPASPPPSRIAVMGEQLYAVSRIALNSKIESIVSLEAVSGGALSGARLSGNATRVDNYFRVELDRALLSDGRECAIQAVALDKETTLAAVRSGVDHHIAYRYGFWGVGTVMSAIGSGARAVANRDLVVTNQGQPIVVERADVNREIRIAIGELGNSLGQDFKKRMDTPATVYVKPFEEMGIYLARSILSSDCLMYQDEKPKKFYQSQGVF